MRRLKDIEANMQVDAINVERYVKEMSKVCWDMFRATGAIFEQEHLRFTSMITAAGCNGGGTSGTHGHIKGLWSTK